MLYALLDNKVNSIGLECPERISQGGELAFNVTIDSNENNDRHVVRAVLLSPSGEGIRHYSWNKNYTGNSLSGTFKLALNDQVKDYTLRVRDVATGVVNEKIVKVYQENIFLNGDFSLGLNEIWKYNFVPIETAGPEAGSVAMHVPAGKSDFKAIQYVSKKTGDRTYELEFMVKGDPGKSVLMSFELVYQEDGVTKVDYRHSSRLCMNGTWRKFSRKFTPVEFPGNMAVIYEAQAGIFR